MEGEGLVGRRGCDIRALVRLDLPLRYDCGCYCSMILLMIHGEMCREAQSIYRSS